MCVCGASLNEEAISRTPSFGCHGERALKTVLSVMGQAAHQEGSRENIWLKQQHGEYTMRVYGREGVGRGEREEEKCNKTVVASR